MPVVGSVQRVPACAGSGSSDDIDFEIKDADTQSVEIKLDLVESAIAEAGAKMFKAPSIAMQTVCGDGKGNRHRGEICERPRRVHDRVAC